MKYAFLALGVLLAVCVTQTTAGPQPKGYIANHSGAQCWYTQSVSPDAQYFHKIPGKSYELKFDDPQCMKAGGLEADINKMMMNNAIARNYSHADAKFMTRTSDLMRSSALQVKGICIQSATYPSAGVAVDYQTAGSSIQSVRHAATLGQCSN